MFQREPDSSRPVLSLPQSAWAMILSGALILTGTIGAAQDQDRTTALAGLEGEARLDVLVDLTAAMASESPRQALDFGTEALELLERHPADRTRRDVLIPMTYAAVSIGDLESATALAERAVALGEKLADAESRARTQTAHAVVLNALARYNEAIAVAATAAEWAQQQDDPEVLGSVFNVQGNIHFERGNSAAALENYFEALRLFEQADRPPRVAMALNNVGSVYLSIENYDESLKYYSRALELSRELDQRELSAILLLNMANIYGELGNRDEELTRYRNALAIAEEIGHRQLQVSVLINLSDVYLASGQHADAMTTALEAQAMSAELANPALEALAIANHGQALVAAGREREGLARLEEALQTVAGLGADLQTQEFLSILSSTHERLGDHAQALTYFKRYKDVTDQLADAQTRERIAEVQAQYESERQEKEIAILTRDRELQALELERQTTVRNSFIALTAMLVLLIAILIQRFRFKAKAHRQLSAISRKLERQALTDPLTKLHNRRYFVGRIGDLVSAESGATERFAILLVDLDRFKRINDAHGHEVGDKVLITFADRLRGLTRSGDILVRWGGEEFLLLSRKCDADQAAVLAERIVSGFEANAVSVDGATIQLRCSVGYATHPFLDGDPDSTSWEQVLRIADNALYLAKQGGRNTWIGVRARHDRLGDTEMEAVLERLDEAAAAGWIELRQRS